MPVISEVIVNLNSDNHPAGLIPPGGLWNCPIGLGAEGYPPRIVPFGWDARRSEPAIALQIVFDIPSGNAALAGKG